MNTTETLALILSNIAAVALGLGIAYLLIKRQAKKDAAKAEKEFQAKREFDAQTLREISEAVRNGWLD